MTTAVAALTEVALSDHGMIVSEMNNWETFQMFNNSNVWQYQYSEIEFPEFSCVFQFMVEDAEAVRHHRRWTDFKLNGVCMLGW
jgi:hypothetical protein